MKRWYHSLELHIQNSEDPSGIVNNFKNKDLDYLFDLKFTEKRLAH